MSQIAISNTGRGGPSETTLGLYPRGRGLATHEELARKVAQHDREIGVLFKHVKALLEPPDSPKNPIGFGPPDDGPSADD